tara:strand:+ start:288 stop:494 length:207 start_codon:yes stop_codon:yes gene_type:complete
MDVKNILIGWGNLLIRPEHITPLMQERMSICDVCPVRTDSTCDEAKGGCGCFLPAKHRSSSKCPKDKW